MQRINPALEVNRSVGGAERDKNLANVVVAKSNDQAPRPNAQPQKDTDELKRGAVFNRATFSFVLSTSRKQVGSIFFL